MNIDQVENRALWVTVAVSVVMAIAGWVTYHLTGSQAMLLDGNFSFVLAGATVIAIIISKNKHKKSSTFPFGNYVYEAAFILSKGLLILGIIVAAFFQNMAKILNYFNGEKPEMVIMEPIYYYVGLILLLTGALLLYFRWENQKSNNGSGMLMVESESAKIDGALTLATGIAFAMMSLIKEGSSLEFLLYIGDSLLVLILGLMMIGSPIQIIKNAFIELGGGSIQNQNEKEKIESSVDSVIQNRFPFDSFITKLGSSYWIVIYVDFDLGIETKEYHRLSSEIKRVLKKDFETIFVDIALKDNHE